jgi:hypothetical protein
MLPLEVAVLMHSKTFASLRTGCSAYFGMIIASGEPPSRGERVSPDDQLRHYTMFDQKLAPIDPALFARGSALGKKLSPMPADG